MTKDPNYSYYVEHRHGHFEPFLRLPPQVAHLLGHILEPDPVKRYGTEEINQDPMFQSIDACNDDNIDTHGRKHRHFTWSYELAHSNCTSMASISAARQDSSKILTKKPSYNDSLLSKKASYNEKDSVTSRDSQRILPKTSDDGHPHGHSSMLSVDANNGLRATSSRLLSKKSSYSDYQSSDQHSAVSLTKQLIADAQYLEDHSHSKLSPRKLSPRNSYSGANPKAAGTHGDPSNPSSPQEQSVLSEER